MNRRNANVILRHNPRRFYPLVDDKLRTKKLLEEHGIPAPKLYFSIADNYDLKLIRQIEGLTEFAVKPARGSAGRGILVLVDKDKDKWKTAGGALLSMEDIIYHVENILSGLYSLGGVNDSAFFEYCIRMHNAFSRITYHGVPDIRVIIYRGIPLMSMLRLPTKKSGGKANLHQGAIGVGVDMVEGVTLGGVYRDRFIDIHPDTDSVVSGVQIPFWRHILEIAVKTFDVFKLGYFGVDFVIDASLGPLILELNARPGLSIQLANRNGIMSRLKLADKLLGDKKIMGPEQRMEVFHTISKKFASG